MKKLKHSEAQIVNAIKEHESGIYAANWVFIKQSFMTIN